MRLKSIAASALVLAFAASPPAAEEGMWTYDNFPIARVNQTYGANIDQAWLDRVRAASIRLSTGCSASIVSDEGLVLTNNHCVESCVQNLSTADNQYAQTGFLPASRDEELRCQGMQAEVLISIEDVTGRVRAAGEGLEGRAFTQARDAMMAAIETEACAGRTELRCQVVSLYRGGQFKLYTYEKYEDVRLAFAPEEAAGSFGGDLDNFNFPRFSLDAAFLRLYSDGRPMQTPTHLGWDAGPPQAGELVVVSGSPGSTQRLLTMEQLETVRDVVLQLDQLSPSELRGRLIRYAAEGEEQAFIAGSTLSGVENSYKRGRGQARALIDTEFMAGRAAAEQELRDRVAADPALAERIGDPWGEIAALQDDYAELYPAYFFLEGRAGGGSQLYSWARTLVRAARERERPAAERLPEYSDSRLGLLRAQTVAANPTYPELNEIQLEWWLSKTREILTVDDPRIRPLLGDESPEGLAERLIAGTTLADPAGRRARRPRRPQHARRVGGAGRGPDRPRSRAPGRGPLRRLRRQPLSRCDPHPAPDLRPRRGLDVRRPHGRALHHLRRPVRPGNRRPSLRGGAPLARGPRRAGHGHPLQHGRLDRHDRRQLGLPGHQRRRRGDRGELRLDLPGSAKRLRLRPQRQP